MLCPPGATALTNFTDASGAAWLACEDFSTPTGGLTLISAAERVHLPKTQAIYASLPDDAYYLGLGKQAVLDAAPHGDVLGQALLACNHSSAPHTTCFSWSDVERAVPPIRKSGQGGHSDNWEACQGVRSFVGSRSSSNDATFSDFGEDCSHNGFPSALGMLAPGYSVVNWTAVHTGEGAIADWTKYINFTAVADGLVGGTLPILALYFPVLAQNPYHTLSGARYWTMLAAPVPDGGGKREQDVWFRFAQVDCDRAGPDGYGVGASCTAKTQTWETYWYTRNPGKADDAFGPEVSASDAGFYANLLAVHRYWNATLAAEGMMALSLPEAAGTNGTWLQQQATHSLVRSMISRRDTWHPTYGVNPGYGWRGQDGFQDVFTSTATMALEWGALPFAKGVIDNQWNFYVRHDGLINYRAIEVPTVARFLTLLALYHSYSGDDALLLSHFAKAKALAVWLSHRRKLALAYETTDPRYGIPFGNDEADSTLTPAASPDTRRQAARSDGSASTPASTTCRRRRRHTAPSPRWVRCGGRWGRRRAVATSQRTLRSCWRRRRCSSTTCTRRSTARSTSTARASAAGRTPASPTAASTSARSPRCSTARRFATTRSARCIGWAPAPSTAPARAAAPTRPSS